MLKTKILNISNIITDLKSRQEIRKLYNIDTFNKLREISIIESVKGSNAIEGIGTTEKRFKEIIKGSKPITHNEKELLGYKNVLNEIHNYYGQFNFCKDDILYFHRELLRETGNINIGKFKNMDNIIMDTFEDGTREVRFIPVSYKETNNAMTQMFLAFYDALSDSEINPLLLIPCVILDFLCIHPFNDGNGRISRLLTVLLLYKFDYDICRYISIESMINKYKDSYYDTLKESSVGWDKNENDYMPFVIFFIQILYYCYKDLDERFMPIGLKKAKKSERIELILMNAYVPISKERILELLPDISVSTVEATLSKLLKENKIIKIGTFKDARYKRK